MNLLQVAEQGVVSGLGLVVAVEQQRAGLLAPAVLVGNTPDGNANTLGQLKSMLACGIGFGSRLETYVKTALHDSDVVVGSGTSNVKLSDGDLLDVGASENLESIGNLGGGVPSSGSSEMGLRADAVDGDTLRDPLVDLANHAGGLSVGGNVKVVVVDEEFGVGVSGACGTESDANEVLAEHTGEDTLGSWAEVAVLSVYRQRCLY
jgi:hypothetical protein